MKWLIAMLKCLATSILQIHIQTVSCGSLTKWPVFMAKTMMKEKCSVTVHESIDVLINEIDKTTLSDNPPDRMKCLKHQINMFHWNAHLLVINFNGIQIMLQQLVEKICCLSELLCSVSPPLLSKITAKQQSLKHLVKNNNEYVLENLGKKCAGKWKSEEHEIPSSLVFHSDDEICTMMF